MQFADIFSLSSPASWVLWFIVLTLAMYFARLPAHRVILTLTRAIYRALRMGGLSVMRAADKLVLRNREVLLASGREAAERIVEREFERKARKTPKNRARSKKRLYSRGNQGKNGRQPSGVRPHPPGWPGSFKGGRRSPRPTPVDHAPTGYRRTCIRACG